jgi:hypothetical protein
VSSEALKLLPKQGFWKEFYKRYPGSGGIIVFSPVGFNPERTRAIVYSGDGCGLLCGEWNFHLFQKINGSWTEAPGVNCHEVS